MTQTHYQGPRRWLAGWYVIPADNAGEFLSRRAPEGAWAQAAQWLHQQLGQGAPQWHATPVATFHVATARDRYGRPESRIEDLSFPDCLHFMTWALERRTERCVWGRDAHRCYYIIPADHPDAGTPARLPMDATSPLPRTGAREYAPTR